MFLGLLNEAQRNSFLAPATKLVMADGTIEPEERVMLDLRVAEMGGNAKATPAEIYGPPNTGGIRQQTRAGNRPRGVVPPRHVGQQDVGSGTAHSRPVDIGLRILANRGK